MKIIILIASVLIITSAYFIQQHRQATILDPAMPLVPPREEQQKNLNNQQSLLAPEEELIYNFFALINNKEIPEAITLMSPNLVPDDSAKQAWGVQFNAIKSIHILSIQETNQEMWTDISKEYEVILEAYVDEAAATAVIPYYGWADNPNVRFITVWQGSDNRYYIDQIGTGR